MRNVREKPEAVLRLFEEHVLRLFEEHVLRRLTCNDCPWTRHGHTRVAGIGGLHVCVCNAMQKLKLADISRHTTPHIMKRHDLTFTTLHIA